MTSTTTSLPQIGQWHDLAGLTALQDARLPWLLARAAGSPFYRDRIGPATPRSRESLADLPLTTKQDLRDAYPFGLLAVPSGRAGDLPRVERQRPAPRPRPTTPPTTGSTWPTATRGSGSGSAQRTCSWSGRRTR